ncbi:unnamed protein product [Amoebophrya sp. A120]|nr:unnamed protein product [Amoebophrya sp. A120]|eukprot:GSA120T00020691001.1
MEATRVELLDTEEPGPYKKRPEYHENRKIDTSCVQTTPSYYAGDGNKNTTAPDKSRNKNLFQTHEDHFSSKRQFLQSELEQANRAGSSSRAAVAGKGSPGSSSSTTGSSTSVEALQLLHPGVGRGQKRALKFLAKAAEMNNDSRICSSRSGSTPANASSLTYRQRQKRLKLGTWFDPSKGPIRVRVLDVDRLSQKDLHTVFKYQLVKFIPAEKCLKLCHRIALFREKYSQQSYENLIRHCSEDYFGTVHNAELTALFTRCFSTISIIEVVDYVRKFGQFSKPFLAGLIEKQTKKRAFDFVRYENLPNCKPLPHPIIAKPFSLSSYLYCMGKSDWKTFVLEELEEKGQITAGDCVTGLTSERENRLGKSIAEEMRLLGTSSTTGEDHATEYFSSLRKISRQDGPALVAQLLPGNIKKGPHEEDTVEQQDEKALLVEQRLAMRGMPPRPDAVMAHLYKEQDHQMVDQQGGHQDIKLSSVSEDELERKDDETLNIASRRRGRGPSTGARTTSSTTTLSTRFPLQFTKVEQQVEQRRREESQIGSSSKTGIAGGSTTSTDATARRFLPDGPNINKDHADEAQLVIEENELKLLPGCTTKNFIHPPERSWRNRERFSFLHKGKVYYLKRKLSFRPREGAEASTARLRTRGFSDRKPTTSFASDSCTALTVFGGRNDETAAACQLDTDGTKVPPSSSLQVNYEWQSRKALNYFQPRKRHQRHAVLRQRRKEKRVLGAMARQKLLGLERRI